MGTPAHTTPNSARIDAGPPAGVRHGVRLVSADTSELFAARLNESMWGGWVPQGGVSVGFDLITGDRYFQAVVRDAVLGRLVGEAEAAPLSAGPGE